MMQRALSLAVLAYLCIFSTASANGHDSSKSKSPKSESAGNPLVRKRSQRGSLARYSDEYNDEHVSGDSSEVDGIFMHLAEEDIYNGAFNAINRSAKSCNNSCDFYST